MKTQTGYTISTGGQPDILPSLPAGDLTLPMRLSLKR
jgi:hypothetical protein